MRSVISILAAALVVYTARRARAQDPQYAPLFLSISGSGSISPFSDGDSLQVGLSYSMTAIPNPGFVFANWEPVNVFEISTWITNSSGPTNIIQLVRSPQDEFYETPELTFIMQPFAVVFSSPLETVRATTGWQANFEPVPEPSGMALSLAGLAALELGRKIRPQRGRGRRDF